MKKLIVSIVFCVLFLIPNLSYAQVLKCEKDDASSEYLVPACDATTGNFNVDVGSLPLPAGAATEATLSSLDGKVTACNTGSVTLAGGGYSTEATLSSLDGKVTACNTGSVTLAGGGYATEATLATLDGKVTACNTGSVTLAGGGYATEATLATLDGKVTACNTGSVTLAGGGYATEATLSSLDGKVTACNTGSVTLAGGGYSTETTLSNVEGYVTTVAGWDDTHGAAVGTNGNMTMMEAKDFDGSALPNAVTEGQASRPASTLSGIPMSFITNEDGSAKPLITHGNAISAVNGGTVVLMSGAEVQSTQPAAHADGDGARFLLNANQELVNAGYTWATNSNRTEEIDPLDQKYISQVCYEWDAGDCAAAACNGTSHCYIDMHGWTGLACQVTWTAGAGGSTLALTTRVTMQDDGTAAASCTYQDGTNDIYGVANFSATDMVWPSANVSTIDHFGLVHYVDVQVVIGANTDGATALYVWCKKAALR